MNAPVQIETHALSRPIEAGAPVVYWRLGATHETRYDVADQPMKGEMDPFFFLTKHKNFIPHEYPCRTQFAAERRGKRPQVVGEFEAARVWLPFDSPRVDLSGFWFRPTVIGTWARTVISCAKSGKAKLSLRTCGGAVLWVNGKEAGWMAPYGRNLEAAQEFEVKLAKGANDIRLWFDDLAERDARYYFQLDYLEGPDAEHALPTEVEGGVAAAMEAALEAMHFEKPAYGSGEVALVTDAPLPVAADVKIVVEGDFMSIEKPTSFRMKLKKGASRLPVAPTQDLPADFRHFKVTLSVAGFAVSRVFGVDICHADRQGTAPATLDARIVEALNEVSEHAESDTVRALARLATGRGGKSTDAMIAGALPAIEDCHDCADFILVPLIWARFAYGDAIAPAMRKRIDAATLGYRFWMDEPGNDVQWYFSENHALLFHTAAYLAGHFMPDAVFLRSQRKGAEQSKVGLGRVRGWLDHFEKWEMAEFNSAPYFPIDLKGLTILYALAPHADVRRRAGKAIVRLLEVVARSAHHGTLTGAQGRSYEHTLRASRSLELSGMARMLWGKGNYGMRFHALPQLALCLRDHGLKVPAKLEGIANFAKPGGQEWVFAQGQDRIAKLYHYKTRDFALGTAAKYRWDEWGYQETVLHLRLGENPDAQVWVNHPGETIHSGYGRPSYWGGSGTLPRVHQYRGLAVAVFDCHDEQPDFTHCWFPRSAFDEATVDGRRAFVRIGDAVAMVAADRAFEPVASGPTAGNELRVPGRKATWLLRAGNARSLARFEQDYSALEVKRGKGGLLEVTDPQYGVVKFHKDGRVETEGRIIDPKDWTVAGRAELFSARGKAAALSRALARRPTEEGSNGARELARPPQRRSRTMKKIVLAALATGLLSSTAAIAGDVRIMWYTDGVEGEVMKDLVDRFNKANPGINVILDDVGYKVVQEQLPVELEAGKGPDIARVTNLKTIAQHWLDLRPYIADAAYWEKNFGDQFDWMRPDGSDAITGFMTQLTLTGGFANKTLFEQAGVEMPGDGATWDQWVEAAGKVKESQQLNAAIVIDRSGHRISAPIASYGGNYIRPDRLPAPIDEGTKTFAKKLVDWTAAGLMNKETWVSAAGTTYRPGIEDFINAQVAFYYSGSWQIAALSTKIGSNFDWVATGSPCGPAGCSGLPGGAALVGIKYTKNPEEVGKVMDYLASEAVVKEFTERTLFLPAHKGVAAGTIDFKTDDANVKAALAAFVKATGQVLPTANALPAWKWATPIYGILVTRISQVMAGEMSIDDAYLRIDEDIKAKVAEAK